MCAMCYIQTNSPYIHVNTCNIISLRVVKRRICTTNLLTVKKSNKVSMAPLGPQALPSSSGSCNLRKVKVNVIHEQSSLPDLSIC